MAAMPNYQLDPVAADLNASTRIFLVVTDCISRGNEFVPQVLFESVSVAR
jgi:hypothetical protein